MINENFGDELLGSAYSLILRKVLFRKVFKNKKLFFPLFYNLYISLCKLKRFTISANYLSKKYFL